MYARGEGRSHLLLGVYVDDLIVTGADTEEIGRFKQQMMDKFRMSDLGLLSLLPRHQVPAEHERHRPVPGRVCKQVAGASGHGRMQP
jgi:hypothetical protein